VNRQGGTTGNATKLERRKLTITQMDEVEVEVDREYLKDKILPKTPAKVR
jgi:preprotein translocase subunit YajC